MSPQLVGCKAFVRTTLSAIAQLVMEQKNVNIANRNNTFDKLHSAREEKGRRGEKAIGSNGKDRLEHSRSQPREEQKL